MSTRIPCAVALLLVACSKEEPGVAPGTDFRKVALEFAQSLAARDYAKAHAMATEAYRKRTSVDQLKAAFEAIVPLDWRVGQIAVGETMATWPDRQAHDLGWAYVSIGGDTYSEAVTVVVAAENGAARIRHVEFGRP
jgi:hypothetical protein